MFSAASKTSSQPAVAANYIEDVFSTYLYTGNGGTQNIVNGINLNVAPVQVSLVGYTLTNLGGAFNSSFPMARINDGIVETTNAANVGYVENTAGYFDVYVDMTTPTTFIQINIAPQGTQNSAVYNTPTDFIVKASNDASTWTTVATFTGVSTGYPNWNAGSFREFSFTNSTAYRYWRFENTSYGSGGAGITVSELRFSTAGSSTGKNGLVWLKSRSAATNHFLFDTTRGTLNEMNSNTTDAQASLANSLTSFNSNGFSLGSAAGINVSAATYCSWTFTQQPKFFDIVTFTSTETTNQRVSHNLGSVPGMIFVKKTSGAGSWFVYHRSEGRGKYLALQSTIASQTQANFWGTSDPTSTDFGLDSSNVAASGDSLVAYLFAHDAGGFGTAGTDNVISCGSFTCNGSGFASVNLGYEPQWLLVKRTDGSNNWWIADNMRGLTAPTNSYQMLQANTSNAEATATNLNINATGFTSNNAGLAGMSFIYMAIRRPMKVPTTGTSVLDIASTSAATLNFLTEGFDNNSNSSTCADMIWGRARTANTSYFSVVDRLRKISSPGLGSPRLMTTNTDAEISSSAGVNAGIYAQANTAIIVSGDPGPTLGYAFHRAAGFFDEVCYTGTGTTQTVTHNLGVAPELVIVKQRNDTGSWYVWAKPVISPNSDWWRNYGYLNNTSVFADWGDNTGINSAPTSTTITYGGWTDVNGSGNTFVNYLFATCPGVSKVGSYTGNGTTQAISCGFTGGARFVLIKPTSADNGWYVYDTARGMTTITNPYLRLNSTAAESATLGSVTTTTGGFTVNATILAAINTNAVSYIFLAIA